LSRGKWVAVLAAILVLACLLRWVGLARYGFDEDEVFSLGVASNDWLGLLRDTARDVSHPPLFYALLKVWLLLGPPTVFWTRLLPAILGVGALLPLAGSCSALRIGRAETALVLVLAGINALMIDYAHYVRMFSLLQFTASLSLYVFVLIAKDPVTRVRIAAAIVVNLLLVYSHYWGWMVFLSEFLAMLYVDRSKIRVFALIMICVAIGFAPWAAAVIDVVLHRGNGMRQISWMGSSIAGVDDYTWLFGKLNGSFDFPHSTILGILLYGIPIVALLLYSLSRREPSVERLRSPLTWIIVIASPMLLTSAASYFLHQNMWGERHMSITAIPYYLLLALSLSRSPLPKIATGAIAAMIGLWAIGAGAASLADLHQRIDWPKIADAVAADRKDPVLIYASEGYVARPLQFQMGQILGIEPKISLTTNLARISSDRFWYVYRNRTWPLAEQPAVILSRALFVIDREVSSSDKWQTVKALLVHKQQDAH